MSQKVFGDEICFFLSQKILLGMKSGQIGGTCSNENVFLNEMFSSEKAVRMTQVLFGQSGSYSNIIEIWLERCEFICSCLNGVSFWTVYLYSNKYIYVRANRIWLNTIDKRLSWENLFEQFVWYFYLNVAWYIRMMANVFEQNISCSNVKTYNLFE